MLYGNYMDTKVRDDNEFQKNIISFQLPKSVGKRVSTMNGWRK